jgi:hypothetical protein
MLIRNPTCTRISLEAAMSHQVGIFATRDQAEVAVHALIKAGFAKGHISVFAQASTTPLALDSEKDEVDEAIDSGGLTGAELGLALGGLGGVLADIGLLAIPGIGPLIAAGPIAAGITAAILGGSFGGVAGSLIGLGVSKAEAHLVEQHLKAGKTILVVTCEERGGDVRAIFANAGAASNVFE